MTQLLLKKARIFDGWHADCAENMQVLVADGRIQEISQGPIKIADDARVIDASGLTLMPGMIDAHVHAFASDVAVARVEALGEAYRAAYATRMLNHALQCGFTTVRDVGGGNYSLYRALADGLIAGPRYFYAGRILSMTGGHGDMRQLEERPRYYSACACGDGPLANSFSVLADGVDECIKSAREELRQGAHCIKIMGSGGVLSPTDPIWMNQYREDEIRAIVNECTERRSYVAAHCHPASAVRRCVEYGVRSIEHGTLIDDDTAEFVARHGAFIVPTMAVCFALVETGRKLGLPSESQEKVEQIAREAISGLDRMRRAGVDVCYGTDLLGSTHVQQCREFTIRREVFSPLELLRQATSTPAEMMLMQGQIGCVAPGAHADLLLVEGDPLKDISVLAADGQFLRLIVRGGEVVKDRMS
ncbi:MAG TPA: amidohydrolase family protein [Ramlibacter sp.]|uniref:metal-dependent hydrolase family protein n=1 Tax=Ramlibacter sp. TaxID=1917967 RepID=UPI002C76F516|nr:amidohydrolase family protein [Ramlibacter sp.]HVZ46235.1 amidohydrolase family protein [Ramlibacter sp.]